MKKFIFDRLKEPSTWQAIIWLCTALGISLRNEEWQYIATIGMSLVGLIGVSTRDRPDDAQVNLPEIKLDEKPEATIPSEPAVNPCGPDFSHWTDDDFVKLAREFREMNSERQTNTPSSSGFNDR